MVNKIKECFEQLSKDYDFLFKHKILIWYLSYWIGVIFQLLILFSILWFTGLSYLSISYSIILFLILAFLFVISIPTLFLFIIGVVWISIVNIWDTWIAWRIIWWLYIILIISLPFILNKCFPEKIKELKSKYSNKIENIYIKWTLIMFVIIFSSFIYWTFNFKVAYIETITKSEEWKIFWKYLFYNKDYHFLDVCWKKLVIPGNQVKSIEIKTTSYEINWMKDEEKIELNKEYNNYCNNINKLWIDQ